MTTFAQTQIYATLARTPPTHTTMERLTRHFPSRPRRAILQRCTLFRYSTLYIKRTRSISIVLCMPHGHTTARDFTLMSGHHATTLSRSDGFSLHLFFTTPFSPVAAAGAMVWRKLLRLGRTAGCCFSASVRCAGFRVWESVTIAHKLPRKSACYIYIWWLFSKEKRCVSMLYAILPRGVNIKHSTRDERGGVRQRRRIHAPGRIGLHGF